MSVVVKNNLLSKSKPFPLAINRFYSTGLLHKEEESIKERIARSDEEWLNAKTFSEIPGPTKLGLIRAFLPGGNLYKVSVINLATKLRDIYGPIVRFPAAFLRPEIIFTFNAEDFEKIHRTEGIWPMKLTLDSFTYFREHVRPEVFKGAGGLANSNGKAWADLRMKVNPILLKPKTIKHHLPEVDEITQDFLKRIDEILDPKTKETPANFATEVSRWTLESVGIFAINTRLGVIGNAESTDGTKLMAAIRTFFVLMYELEIKPSIWKYYKTSKFYQMMDALNIMTDVSIKYVSAALKRYEEKKANDPNYQPQGVLEMLVEADELSGTTMAMDMLVAGTDTTSSLFLGVLYRIAKSKKAQDKLREEVMRILPEKNSKLTSDKMASLPYLRACIKETQRIMPVVTGNARCTGQDLVLSGYQIPKGTTMLMATMALTSDEKYYPRNSEFLPERWLRNDSSNEGCPSARDVNPFVYLPFGFGPRSCIGRRIAELNIEVTLCRIIRNYRVSWNHPDMEYTSNIVTAPTGDLKFKFEKLPN